MATLRWATTTVALLLAATGSEAASDAVVGVVGAALLSFALWRTFRPVDHGRRASIVLSGVVVEAAVVISALVLTGYWESPFAFCVLTVVTAGGFTGGISLAGVAAAGCALAVSVPYHLLDPEPNLDLTVQWCGELLAVALLAGFARHLVVQGRMESSRYRGRLRQLMEMNELLLGIHQAARSLPNSLDLEETLTSSASRLRELFAADVVVVLLHEEGAWRAVRTFGVHLGARITSDDLPPALQGVRNGGTTRIGNRGASGDPSPVAPDATTGLYASLVAGQNVVGLVAVERQREEPFTEEHVAVMNAFAQQMAIAVDNARWFSRIGTLAAEQERSRIARDLHDRVGQSLATVGFEIDRVARHTPAETRDQLLGLRENVRAVVTELRETLHDLRTDVSEDRDLMSALVEFTDRVSGRSGLVFEIDDRASARPPLAVEREVWRIAQEAVSNVERHARASRVTLRWSCDQSGSELTVTDDGVGVAEQGSGRGGYGLLGMHERAQAIGASLEISSSPGKGTTVHLVVPN